MTVAPPRDGTTAPVGSAATSGSDGHTLSDDGSVPRLREDPHRETWDRTRRRARRIARSRELGWFAAFLGPNLALIIAFTYFPLVTNMYYSTLDWRLGSSRARFVGLANYREFLSSSQGLDVWRVTLVFTVVTVAASMLLGLAMSVVLNRNFPGRGLARTAVFAPYVLSGVGVGLIWNFVFDPNIGILAHVLRTLGQQSPQWFLDPTLSLVMVIVVYVWKNVGFCAVLYLAGLQSIPQDLLEAAALDGAGPVRRFFSVTLPLLGPTTFFLTVTTILNSMQAFDILRTMTPTGNGTNSMVFEIYLQSFGDYQRAGYAAAISVVLFLVLLAVTGFQIRYVEKKVHYA